MPYIYTYLSSSYSWCFKILCPVIYLPAAMRGKLKEEAISYTNLGSDNPLSQLDTGKHFLSRVKKGSPTITPRGLSFMSSRIDENTDKK
ncbi:hypothetical protein Bpfe_023507 [Biomphalaria pfeifferi]|uniref:Uncharacterized protein n=1 Tax=Biomphalaria pfeifferi TaxID=112525 RepID=A0AAD8F203_BIOPF|nr:hypothetical protein Bpfe_023507 [Biomphalaria pfeifferi]